MSTGIQWTDDTWNPTIGCMAVSPGCDRCYAATMAHTRLAKDPNYKGLTFSDGRFNGTVRLLPERLTKPLSWRSPRRIFVDSMSDLFHDDVPDDYIARVWATMASAGAHTFQILTKRHARMRSLLSNPDFPMWVAEHWTELLKVGPSRVQNDMRGDWWPLPNVWLGVSVEDQHWAGIRIDHLRQTPAAVHFLSCEPLLGPITLRREWFHGQMCPMRTDGPMCACIEGDPRIDWVIVGGESGHDARPMHPGWASWLRDQCAENGVAFLFKQWGEWAPVHDQPRKGDIWHLGLTSEGRDVRYPWEPGSAGAPADRFSPFADALLRKVGKHSAGRMLDGRTWDEYPA